MEELVKLVSSFPKVRPPLSAAHARLYEREYQLNREGTAPIERLAKWVESWMHRCVARHSGEGPTLELGAGTLNHLKYETVLDDYDVVEPFEALFSGNPLVGRVRHIYSDQRQIPLRPAYARIVSIAVLEHMTDLPRELARSGVLLRPQGVFQAGIPSEGGFLWWLGWRCTTGISYWLRNRLDYGVVMRHEHVNTSDEIVALVRLLFRDVRIRRFPLPHRHLSLYAYIEARDPMHEACESILLSADSELHVIKTSL